MRHGAHIGIGMQRKLGRVGEMEVWALEGFSVAHMLQEILLTYKYDRIRIRAPEEVLGT
jgi:DNA-directed RNA polymerase subunit beta